MGHFQLSRMFIALLMLLPVTQATLFDTFYEMVEPGLNITGTARAALSAKSKRHCSIMCLQDKNCYAYQYRQTGHEKCVLIYTMCSVTGGDQFEREESGIIYRKGWGLQPRWKGPKPVLYVSFDGSDGLVLMERTQKINHVPLVSGQVNCAWTFKHTKKQWVDLGIHTEVCMTRPQTCSAAGGAISLWMNLLGCPGYGAIISSVTDQSSGVRMYCHMSFRFEIFVRNGSVQAFRPVPSGWTHVVLNYLGQGIRTYYNGTEVGSGIHGVADGQSAGDGRVVIGRSKTNVDSGYNSVQVDELIFFNQALSQDDITMLYNGA